MQSISHRMDASLHSYRGCVSTLFHTSYALPDHDCISHSFFPSVSGAPHSTFPLTGSGILDTRTAVWAFLAFCSPPAPIVYVVYTITILHTIFLHNKSSHRIAPMKACSYLFSFRIIIVPYDKYAMMCQTVPKCANFQFGTTKFCKADPWMRCTDRMDMFIIWDISSQLQSSR